MLSLRERMSSGHWLMGILGLVALLVLAGCVMNATETVVVPEVTATTELPTASSPTALPTERPTTMSTELPTALPPEPAPTPTPASSPLTEGSGNADVVHVRAVLGPDGNWTFHVTVQHPDTGWGDYADGWDVVTLDGTVLQLRPDDPFTRLLAHPHVEEQPFTRSQSGILIPDGVTQVRVRAHDLVDGYGGRKVLVDLAVDSGPGFEVERP